MKTMYNNVLSSGGNGENIYKANIDLTYFEIDILYKILNEYALSSDNKYTDYTISLLKSKISLKRYEGISKGILKT